MNNVFIKAFANRQWRQWLTVLSTALLFGLAGNAYAYKDLSKAPAGNYELEKTHAYIGMSYLHQGYSRPILFFRAFDATLELDPENIENSKVSVKIDPASIDSGVAVFDEHLLDDKMFHVEKFPEAGFESSSIEARDDGTYVMRGNLTAKGISKLVRLDVVFNKGGDHFQLKKPHLGFSASGKILRSDWNLGYATPFVGDEVELIIEVEMIKSDSPGASE